MLFIHSLIQKAFTVYRVWVSLWDGGWISPHQVLSHGKSVAGGKETIPSRRQATGDVTETRELKIRVSVRSASGKGAGQGRPKIPRSVLRVRRDTRLDAESVRRDRVGTRCRSLNVIPLETGNPREALGWAITRWCLWLARTSLQVQGEQV